jgi:hypothetical protein
MELDLSNLPDENDFKKLVDIEARASRVMKLVFNGKRMEKDELGQLTPEMFMGYLFTERQIRHTESFSLLITTSDKILISRTMFEGALFLAYAIKTKNTKELAKRWKLHFFVEYVEHSNEKGFPADLKKQIEENITDIDRFFKNSKGRYSNKWQTENIHDIALSLDVVCKSMYVNYYKPMAEYHHWSALSILQYSHVNANERGSQIKNIVDLTNSYLISVFSTLLVSKIFLTIFSNKSDIQISEIEKIEKSLSELSFIKTKKITVSSIEIEQTHQI